MLKIVRIIIKYLSDGDKVEFVFHNIPFFFFLLKQIAFLNYWIRTENYSVVIVYWGKFLIGSCHWSLTQEVDFSLLKLLIELIYWLSIKCSFYLSAIVVNEIDLEQLPSIFVLNYFPFLGNLEKLLIGITLALIFHSSCWMEGWRSEIGVRPELVWD